jgi:16S rRNA (guanine527-N7)-methyltransferase
MPMPIDRLSQALRDHAGDFAVRLRDEDIARLSGYYALLLKWNPRLHLVAPCSPEQFAMRHILESLLLLRHLPGDARVVDVGSGAGLPIIPCLILREDLRATLIESSQKKAAFLREALRGIAKPESSSLIVDRFEKILAPQVDFITCRALDRFQQVLPKLINWAPTSSTLLLFVGLALVNQIEGLLPSVLTEPIPGSERRFLVIARIAAPQPKK